MKIVKEDQNFMVIKDKNIFAFLVGAIFTLAGFLVILKPDFFINRPPIWFGFVGILIGIFVIFMARITTINIDKNTKKLIFRWKTLINEKVKEYDLDLVKQIESQQVYTSNSKGGGGYSYKLVFILNNGEDVPLNPYGSSIVQVMGRQINAEGVIGTRIANFLNIPFRERRFPTVKETLSAIQETVRKEIEEHKKE